MKTHRGNPNTMFQDNFLKNTMKSGYFKGKRNNSHYSPSIHVKKRRINGQIMPDWQNFKNGDKLEGIEYKSYAEQKAYWIGRIMEPPLCGRMDVNREYLPKTNTRESRYKGLRRMLKEGIIVLRNGYVELAK
jgi:hypothetical protein